MPDVKPGTVSIGLATTARPECHEFERSLKALLRWDALHHRHVSVAYPELHCIGGPSLAGKRNTVVRSFLEFSDAEWLLFIDDDQQFEQDLVERMLDSADADERPIVSALIMAERTSSKLPIGPACTIMHEGHFVIPPFIPQERHWQVATIGTGCVIIHRRVLEALSKEYAGDAFRWFKHAQHDGDDGPEEMSEDYVFSLRCAKAGFPLYVDTTIEVGHVKKRVLTTHDFYAQPGVAPPPRRNVAIIPVKGNLRYTKDLVRQLEADEACDEVVIVDNGSPPDMQKWLGSCGHRIIRAEGVGIHAMWNIGASYAFSRPGPVNLLYLNNDVRIGEPFCAPLADALMSDDTLIAVCPNYDGRTGEGVERLHGVCGERYDGTGGLAGFAFMVRGELFSHADYRFPEECMWWWGDTDMCITIDNAGGWYGMVHGVEVEHLDGGGRTGNWTDPEMQKQLIADQQAFRAKWEQAS